MTKIKPWLPLIGIGVFALSVMLLAMMYRSASFRNDEFVQTIATLVIGTAFVGGVVAWAYAATKGGGELAERNATIVEKQASTPAGAPSDPIAVTETQP